MEKSQGTGIERNKQCDACTDSRRCDAWKNPKERELKERKVKESTAALVRDAWKNPKERELKVCDLWPERHVLCGDAWKNPKERELKGTGHDVEAVGSECGCMEKSQGTGIERKDGSAHV